MGLLRTCCMFTMGGGGGGGGNMMVRSNTPHNITLAVAARSWVIDVLLELLPVVYMMRCGCNSTFFVPSEPDSSLLLDFGPCRLQQMPPSPVVQCPTVLYIQRSYSPAPVLWKSHQSTLAVYS